MQKFINHIFSNKLMPAFKNLWFVLVKNISELFLIRKKDITFELTVPVLLPVRTAHGSLFFIGFPNPKCFSSSKFIKYG